MRHIVVALSGGRDSVVLLHALHALHTLHGTREAASPAAATSAPDNGADTPAYGWTLSAHHIHHGLSGYADAWAAHCEALCASLAVPLKVTRVSIDRADPRGIEAAARAARYTALAAGASGDAALPPATIVALAHHARDQAETVLLQLLRGAGPRGLAAMPADTVGAPFARPLLALAHAAIEAYAAQYGLTWVDDDSNADPRFARNRLRHRVWPALQTAFPAAERTLARASRLQAEAGTLLDDLAKIDLATVSGADSSAPEVRLLCGLSPARQANVLRHWLALQRLPLPPENALHDWLRQLASVNPTQTIRLGLGAAPAAVVVYRGRLQVAWPELAWPAQIWNGEATVALGGHCGVIEFRAASAGDADALRAPRPGERWLLRRRQAGDAVALSARSGHVSIKNIMQDAGIPPWQRNMWPLLICNKEIVAVAGLSTAFAFTVGATVRSCDGAGAGWRCQWKPAWRSGTDSPQ